MSDGFLPTKNVKILNLSNFMLMSLMLCVILLYRKHYFFHWLYYLYSTEDFDEICLFIKVSCSRALFNNKLCLADQSYRKESKLHKVYIAKPVSQSFTEHTRVCKEIHTISTLCK